VISVVVPASDEAAVIGRLLAALTAAAPPGSPELEIVVVANGCTDDTARIAAAVPGVVVIETPVASKARALRLGDQAACGFPRVYVDADVEITRSDVLALAAALTEPGVHAVAPGRRLLSEASPLLVRWYYDVWEELPGVREGIFGRGVIAVSRKGHERILALPEVMADDLAMSAAFPAGERRVVEHAVSVVRPPRTWSDLVRRRTRVVTGTRQFYSSEHEAVTDSRTSVPDLLRLAALRPGLAVKLPVFLVVTLIARRKAARAAVAGDYGTWLRDESSRAA
jgi:glycosyltransferase involved in cell wall biosynthesis